MRRCFAVVLATLISSLCTAQQPQIIRTHFGAGTNDRFGNAVVGLGDLDLDGVSDYAIASVYAGRVVVFDGANGTILRVHEGNGLEDEFGGALANAGDTDGDGISDLIVGAWGHDDVMGCDVGKAYLYSGSDGELLHEIVGMDDLGELGFAVAGAGDLNGDGFGDLIISAPGRQSSTGQLFAGRITVFSGIDGLVIHQIEGAVEHGFWGHAVATLGDLNGDGVDDFAACSRYPGPPGLIVYSGLTGDPLHVATERTWNIARLGDIDRDGVEDFAALHSLNSGAVQSFVRVYSGSDGSTVYEVPSQRATSIIAAGDMDGDGLPEFAVGKSYDLNRSGFVRLYRALDGQALWTWVGPLAGDYFGWDVAAVGDVDGDGLDDLAVGGILADSDTIEDTGGAVLIGMPGPLFRRGDANDDGVIDVADPLATLAYVFLNEQQPCLRALDSNDDALIDVADPVYLLNFLFVLGSPPIPLPAPNCGLDPTPDPIACETIPASCP